jgi:hypothetical protein
MREKEKFDLHKALQRQTVLYAPEVTATLNGNTEHDFSQKEVLDSAVMLNTIQKYDLSGRTGVGCVLFIKKLDKEKKRSYGYVVFIDMKYKLILEIHQIEGKPNGFTPRNYWANSFGDMLENMAAEWRRWRKEVL